MDTLPTHRFRVTITETLEKNVEVSATDHAHAQQLVEDEYCEEIHILDSSDFTGVAFYSERIDPTQET